MQTMRKVIGEPVTGAELRAEILAFEQANALSSVEFIERFESRDGIENIERADEWYLLYSILMSSESAESDPKVPDWIAVEEEAPKGASFFFVQALSIEWRSRLDPFAVSLKN